MKLLLSFVVVLALCISCNNDKKDSAPEPTKETLADSLWDQVQGGHDVAMAKHGTIEKLRSEAEHLLDSINKLPAKAQEAAAPFRSKLESVVKDLNDAWEGMEVWMRELSIDSAKNIEIEKRLSYLYSEITEVSKVKDDINNSIAKADSVLKNH